MRRAAAVRRPLRHRRSRARSTSPALRPAAKQQRNEPDGATRHRLQLTHCDLREHQCCIAATWAPQRHGGCRICRRSSRPSAPSPREADLALIRRGRHRHAGAAPCDRSLESSIRSTYSDDTAGLWSSRSSAGDASAIQRFRLRCAGCDIAAPPGRRVAAPVLDRTQRVCVACSASVISVSSVDSREPPPRRASEAPSQLPADAAIGSGRRAAPGRQLLQRCDGRDVVPVWSGGVATEVNLPQCPESVDATAQHRCHRRRRPCTR